MRQEGLTLSKDDAPLTLLPRNSTEHWLGTREPFLFLSGYQQASHSAGQAVTGLPAQPQAQRGWFRSPNPRHGGGGSRVGLSQPVPVWAELMVSLEAGPGGNTGEENTC